jgi:uncharacterized protein with PIN domain
MDKCPKCGGEMKHLHDSAHGIPETHMAGSERYECAKCDKKIYKVEGEKLGLKFICD